MILKKKDIREILKENPNKSLLDRVGSYTSRLIMHMTGKGVEEYIKQLPHFEDADMYKIRRDYAISNKAMFSRIHRPIDKVYSARGGSIDHNLPEAQDKQLREVLGDVEYGYNLRKWMGIFYREAYHYDPMGVILMEIGDDGNAYPTYRSALDVFDYSLNGRDLDYLILKHDTRIEQNNGEKKTIHTYRVIDDAFDYLIEWDGTSYKTVANQTFPNYFGKVPAKIISDIYSPVCGYYISPDDDIIELADQYLREGSVFVTHKNLFMFPIRWMYAGECNKCNGVGQVDGYDCTDCNGTGKKVKFSPRDTLALPFPKNAEQQIVAPNVAGYVNPSTEGVDLMTSSLDMLYEACYNTMWGVETKQRPDGNTDVQKTAYEVINKDQSKIDRLNSFSDAAESMETFITNAIASIKFQNHKGSSIAYGRRYIMDTPDTLWDKYQKAMQAKSPSSELDVLLDDYHVSKYQADSMKLQIQRVITKVTPYIHNTIQEVKNMGLPDVDYARKLYCDEWLKTLLPIDLINKSIKELNSLLTTYATERVNNLNTNNNGTTKETTRSGATA